MPEGDAVRMDKGEGGMMGELEILKRALGLAVEYAREAHASDKISGADSVSVAYAAGRYDGLKQALDILGDVESGRLN